MKEEIRALTGLRGLAAMLIVVHHFGLLVLPLRSTIVGPSLGKCGLLGMSVFFVLSGFVIHYNYARNISAGRQGVRGFSIARFARLYPLYIVFVLANFAFNLTISTEYVTTLPYYLLSIQSWIYSIHYGQVLAVSQMYANNAWSISTEIGLYLLFVPLAMWGKFGTPSVRKGLAIIVVAIIGRIVFVRLSVLYGGDFLQNSFGASPSLAPDQWLIFFSPYGRVFEFLAGVGLSEVWSARAVQGRARVVAMGLGVLACAYIVASFLDGAAYSLPRVFSPNAVHMGYAVSVPLAIFAICLNGKFLCGAVARWIGEISYSLYLVHGVMIPLFSGTDSAAGYVMKAIVFFAMVIVVATLAHVYLEMPAQKAIKSFYGRRSVPPQPPQLYS